MSLTDAKIRTIKPSDKPFKVSDFTVYIFLSNWAAHVTVISSTVSIAKNPASV